MNKCFPMPTLRSPINPFSIFHLDTKYHDIIPHTVKILNNDIENQIFDTELNRNDKKEKGEEKKCDASLFQTWTSAPNPICKRRCVGTVVSTHQDLIDAPSQWSWRINRYWTACPSRACRATRPPPMELVSVSGLIRTGDLTGSWICPG